MFVRYAGENKKNSHPIKMTYSKTVLSKLFAPDEVDPEATRTDYIIAIPPMNSSGDIYHILAYLMILQNMKMALPKVLLTYDSGENVAQSEKEGNTYSQVLRGREIAEQFGFGQYFMAPVKLDTGACQRENNREAKLNDYFFSLGRDVYVVDQKAATSLLAYLFMNGDKKHITECLRAGFSTIDPKVVPESVFKLLVADVTQTIETVQKSAGKQPLIVLHYRYSSKANKIQNIDQGPTVERMKRYLESKGYKIWCVFADGRLKQSFTSVRTERIDPFPRCYTSAVTKVTKDYGKLFHLGVLSALLDLPNLQGVIGNTSGTLDAAALMGHTVLNLHSVDERLAYQDFRMLIQSTFLSIAFIRQAAIKNAMMTVDKKKGELTDTVVADFMGNLDIWLRGDMEENLLPEKKSYPDPMPPLDDSLFTMLFYSKNKKGNAAKAESKMLVAEAVQQGITRRLRATS